MMHTEIELRGRVKGWIVMACLLSLASFYLFSGGPWSGMKLASAASLTVTTTDDELNSDGDCSLREAIAASNLNSSVDACGSGSGVDTIMVPTGTYTLSLGSDLVISESVTLNGSGPAYTVIAAAGSAGQRIFQIPGAGVTLTIYDLTLQDGDCTSGCAFWSNGGGAIFNQSGSTVTLSHVHIHDSDAYFGGAVFSKGTVNIYNSSEISTNSASNMGGGLYAQEPDSSYSGGDVTVEDSTFSTNTASGNGGAIALQIGTVSLDVVDSTFTGNTGANGGAIASWGAATTISGSYFENNTAQGTGGNNGKGQGGAVNVYDAALDISTTTITGNTATNDFYAAGGGILCVEGPLTLTDSTVSGNSVTNISAGGIGRGGGIMLYSYSSSSATISDSSIIDNDITDAEDSGYGGGIDVHTDGGEQATLTISDSSVSGNTLAVGAVARGGGIAGEATTGGEVTLDLRRTTLAGNSADSTLNAIGASRGGGIWIGGSGAGVGLFNVTVSGNASSDPYGGHGGGLSIESGSLDAVNSTLAGNTAAVGKGIANIGGSQTLSNSILTGHAGADCYNGSATLASGGHNVEGGTTCALTEPSDQQSTDPLLGALADNGGPTQTHALLAGSPAIEAGDDALCSAGPINGIDQRGVSRPQGPHCDIGAYEFPAKLPPGLLLPLFRAPSSIEKGSAASGPNQWFARVALGDHTGDPGQAFHYVVWLHVPEDWTLPWATQYSFTGDLTNSTLSVDWAAQSWVQNLGKCPFGGPAAAGFKWRAFRGPEEALPGLADRMTNLVNLRGGLGVPSGETSDVYGGVRVVTGTYYDLDGNGTADSYACDHVAVTNIEVP